MANFGLALLDGLGAGISQYGKMQQDEAAKAEQAKHDQELAELTSKLRRADAKFSRSLQPAQYQTIEDTGPDGKTIKRTIKSRYDEERGPIEEEVGSITVPEKVTPPVTRNVILGNQTQTQQFNPETGKFEGIGQAGPRFAPRVPGDSGDISERERYRQEHLDERERVRQEAINKRLAQNEVNKTMRELSDPFALRNAAQMRGIDPESKNLRSLVKKSVEDEFNLTYGVDGNGDAPKARPLLENVGASGTSYPPLGSDPFGPKKDVFSVPAASPDKAAAPKPAAEKAPYPDGTKLKGKDGKMYIVKDGQPVPYGG